MIPAQIIRRKREGEELSGDDIRSFFEGYASGAVEEYQMAALLMAIFFRGMSAAELAVLVEVMIASGAVADLSAVPGVKVDKHSTGESATRFRSCSRRWSPRSVFPCR